SVTATTTDTQCTYTVGIDARKLADIIGHATNIFNTEERLVRMTRFTSACPLKSSISGYSNKPSFCQSLRIQACCLLFDTAIRVRYSYSNILLLWVIVGRQINICSDVVPI